MDDYVADKKDVIDDVNMCARGKYDDNICLFSAGTYITAVTIT